MARAAEIAHGPSEAASAPAHILRSLAAHCHDRGHGYLRAAEDTSDRYFANEFDDLADERRRMAEELDSVLREMDETIPSGGTPVGRLHLLGDDLATVVSQGNRTRIQEVVPGDSALEQAYVMHRGRSSHLKCVTSSSGNIAAYVAFETSFARS